MRLWLDLETFSAAPITVGTFAYAEQANVLLWAYALDDEPARVWDVAGGAPMPRDLEEGLLLADEVWAHNSMFDRTVLRHAFPKATPEVDRWRDTMVLAMAHSLPGKLEKLCEVLGLPSDKAKDKDGARLIQKFCKPQPKNQKVRIRNAHTDPDDWARFAEYARLDVEAMREVHKRLPKWNYATGPELVLWHLDQRINDRGVATDTALAAAALEAVAQCQRELAVAVSEATDGEVQAATQRDALLNYLAENYSVVLPDLQGATVEKALESEPLPSEVRFLLNARLQASTSSTSKYKALVRATNRDGRVRGLLQFCGAGRTARWSGRTFQPQNLPRPSLKEHQIVDGIAHLKAGSAGLVYDTGYTMRLAASAVRGCLVAPPGRKLCIADLSNIEGRALAWLAGEKWKLKAFAEFDAGRGHDLYALAYSKSFGVTPEAVMENKKSGDGIMRQVGKVMELACGYSGGVGAFATFALGYGIDLDKMAGAVLADADPIFVEEAQEFFLWTTKKKRSTFGLQPDTFIACDVIKRGWRAAHANIVAWWGELEDAFGDAIAHPGRAFKARAVTFDRPMLRSGKASTWVRVRLPSGRCMCYPGARRDPETAQLSYLGVNQYTRKWERIKTYSGKLAENVTQAFARDVLAYRMPDIEANGYEIVLSVHDELLAETPDTDGYSSDALSALMATNPPWATGLPLAAAGFETTRYRKD